MTNYTKTFACRIITTTQFFRKIYLSLYLKGFERVTKGFTVRGSWRPNKRQYIDSHSYGHNSVSFPFPWAAQPGAWGSSFSGCWFSLPHLSPTHLITNSLNFLCSELYNSSTYTFLWASQIALIQTDHGQGYILISLDRMHLLFTQVHFLFWQPGRVEGQYIYIWTHFAKDVWANIIISYMFCIYYSFNLLGWHRFPRISNDSIQFFIIWSLVFS